MVEQERKQKLIEKLSKCVNINDPCTHYDDLIHIREEFQKDKEMQAFIEKLEAIGNANRLLILDTLKKHDLCVCELEVLLGKTQPAVSHHLKILENANLIKGWKRGKFTHYSFVKKSILELKENFLLWLDEIENWFQ
ncbi:MAG: ArsR/SmtB family transcription factor [Promethearchaeota archaeon]